MAGYTSALRLLGILSLQAASLAGATETDDLPEVADKVMDRGHATVSRAVTDLAGSIDGFFSADLHEERINRSRIRVGTGIRLAEDSGVDPLFRLRLDLRMPHMQRRINLVVAGFSDTDDAEATDSNLDDVDDLAGFFRFFLFKGDPTLLTLDAGLRFQPAPDPFVRTRIVREFALGETLFRPTQFLFWQLEEGFGTRTRMDIDRRLNRKTLLRVRGQVTLSQESNGAEIRPALFLYRRIDRRMWTRLELAVESDTDPPRVIERTVAGLRIRRSMWRRWFFVEVEPQVRFDADRRYRPSPRLDLRVEAVLGGDYGH